jgi:hypothetical protein
MPSRCPHRQSAATGAPRTPHPLDQPDRERHVWREQDVGVDQWSVVHGWLVGDLDGEDDPVPSGSTRPVTTPSPTSGSRAARRASQSGRTRQSSWVTATNGVRTCSRPGSWLWRCRAGKRADDGRCGHRSKLRDPRGNVGALALVDHDELLRPGRPGRDRGQASVQDVTARRGNDDRDVPADRSRHRSGRSSLNGTTMSTSRGSGQGCAQSFPARRNSTCRPV